MWRVRLAASGPNRYTVAVPPRPADGVGRNDSVSLMATTVSLPSRLASYGRFVTIEHTVFSIPVILAGTLIAARGWPSARVLLLIVLAGTGARTAALGLNRIIDRHIDARNPRTAGRGLASGELSLGTAWGIVLAGLALYLAAAWLLNWWCVVLSPIPLVAFVLYPYMKRFTPLAHYGVGFGLALAPCGGWMAVRGAWAGVGEVLLLAVFTWGWVAGFDIIYACLDEAFDREAGLHSLPARLGRAGALRAAAVTHAVAFGALAALTVGVLAGGLAYALLAVVGGLLLLEHLYAHQTDLAFFKINTVVGCAVFALVWAGIGGA